MKTIKFKTLIVVLILEMFCLFSTYTQIDTTRGSLTFTVSIITPQSSYTGKHVVAMWISDSANNFIKTKLVRSKTSNYDHLATWTSKSGSSLVDASSGATVNSSNNPLTFTWNGKNLSNKTVKNGTYKVWIEFAWDHTAGKGNDTLSSISFKKSAASVHLAPANSTRISNLVLDWIPTIVSSDETYNDIKEQDVFVYPNPTTGLVNIDFKEWISNCSITVLNSKGAVVYKEPIDKSILGTKIIDLSKFSDGIYIIKIKSINQKNELIYKVSLKK